MNEVVLFVVECGNVNYVSLWNDVVKLKKDRKKEKIVCVFIIMFLCEDYILVWIYWME